MAERAVRIWPDPVLAQACSAVDITDAGLSALVTDLFDTMYAAYGRGLAAPQIGVLSRAFVVDVTWKEGSRDPRVFLNPDIVETSEDMRAMDEQCLSIPNLPMPVLRPDWIILRWTTLDGGVMTERFDGIVARCIQHEMDHLNGTIILDHQTPDARLLLERRYGA